MEQVKEVNKIHDYFWNEVVNKSNAEVSVALENIIILSDIFFDITATSIEDEEIPVTNRMSAKVVALGMAIKAIAEKADLDFHKMEKEHITYFINCTENC